jgi:hypothetical protein
MGTMPAACPGDEKAGRKAALVAMVKVLEKDGVTVAPYRT